MCERSHISAPEWRNDELFVGDSAAGKDAGNRERGQRTAFRTQFPSSTIGIAGIKLSLGSKYYSARDMLVVPPAAG